MKKIEAIIFDMDGTLYAFDENHESQFTSSQFGKQIRANCIRFFEARFSLSVDEAEVMYQDLNDRYNGQVSLAVEKEFGIGRGEYFAFTWDLTAEEFITSNELLVPALQNLTTLSGVLTAAPKVWAERALTFMQIRQLFGEAVFTGDPDIRKPNPEAFLQLANFWSIAPEKILAIGDQEASDILPAKSLGMMTLRIAKQAQTEADFIAPDIITAIALLRAKGII